MLYRNKEKIIRYSTITIDDIVHSKIPYSGKTIIIESFDGYYHNGKFEEMPYYPPQFSIGKKIIVLVVKEKDKYRLYGNAYGKFDIISNIIAQCGNPLDVFIKEISEVTQGKSKTFKVKYPSFYNQKRHERIAKAAGDENERMHDDLSRAFRTSGEWYCYSQPHEIEFKINPTGAFDADSVAIPFNTLKTLVTSACSLWNSIDNTNINFTVHPDSFPNLSYVIHDSLSTISFDSDVTWAGANLSPYETPRESDIRFNTSKKWRLPGQSGGNIIFFRSLAHELGHSVGLDDMGNVDDDEYDDKYTENLMWNTTIGVNLNIETPQDGDKAGAVHMVPNPSGTLQFDEIWSGFQGSANPLNINSNVTVSSGDTLIIESNDEVRFASGVKLEVEGLLIIGSGAKLTRKDAGTYWSGIDVKNGGTLDVDGDITIEYANTGIDVYGTGTISNGHNKITIQNCNQAGVWANDCSPTIRNIYCDNVSDSSLQNGGVTVSGTAANPSIRMVTVKNTYYGMEIASTYASTTVDSCDIQKSNLQHSIQVNSGCRVDLTRDNNINPASGKKAINNPSTGSIDAQYNWWGVSSPTDALFSFPGVVNYTNSESDSIGSMGAYKQAIIAENYEPMDIAQQREFSGDFRGALNIYKDLLAFENDTGQKKFIITSILRVNDHSDRDYTELRNIIDNELKTAQSWYKASLDFILCDLLYREGKYEEALSGFREKVGYYKNTPMEVEMLIRIAEIYGDYMDDTAKAAEYADMAASINPGQDNLRFAYEAAGMNYNASLYEDRLTNAFEGYEHLEEPDDNHNSEREASFTVKPNPFNPFTTLSYTIAEPSHVKLEIYSINGQRIDTLVDRSMRAGTHSVKFNGTKLSSGVYFYRFESKGFKKSGKMLLVK